MPKFMTAPAGTNPMEMPELIQRKRATLKQKMLLIGASCLALACLCSVSTYFLSKPKVAAAVPASPTILASATMTASLTQMPATTSPTPTPTSSRTGFPTLPGPSATPTISPTPRVITQVVTRVVNIGQPYPVVTIQVVTVQIPVIVTTTPGATQTPWIITVEVTPTETPTPEFPTQETPTNTPEGLWETPTATFVSSP